jgi:hypothetical protein
VHPALHNHHQPTLRRKPRRAAPKGGPIYAFFVACVPI